MKKMIGVFLVGIVVASYSAAAQAPASPSEQQALQELYKAQAVNEALSNQLATQKMQLAQAPSNCKAVIEKQNPEWNVALETFKLSKVLKVAEKK